MKKRHRILLLIAGLAAGWAGAASEPGVAARSGYEAGLSKDAAAAELELRDLHRRYAAALDKLQVDARSRGDLDETLAAQRLADRVKPLATGQLIAASAPRVAVTVLTLPAAPGGSGRVQQAHTNYLAKASALAAQFNALSSNRLARYLADLDGAIRERTKAGDLETAVKLRDQRASAAAAGPPRVVVSGPTALPPSAAPADSSPGPLGLVGRWTVPGSAVPFREFRSDDKAYYFKEDGGLVKAAPYRIVGPGTAVVQETDGWIDTYRLLSAVDGMVDARNERSGQAFTNRFIREGAVAGGHPILGTWCETWDAAYPGKARVFEPGGIVRVFESNGVEALRGSYQITGPEAAEARWPSGAIGRYRVLADGRLQCNRVKTDGTADVVYCTRPGVNQAMTVWAPGDEAKGSWAKDWMFEGRGVQTGVAKFRDAHNGREQVWETHPVNAAVPAKWIRTVQLAAGKPHKLSFEVCAGRGSDWALSILVNEDEVLTRVVAGDAWQSIAVNLDRYAGQKVRVELRNGGGGAIRWSHEWAYWSKVVLE